MNTAMPVPGPHDARERLVRLLERVPYGRVVGHSVLARELDLSVRHVMGLLSELNPEERLRVPWHRAVADGGAIGRHAFRDEQMAKLRAEGIAVAPAGIVQGVAERRIGSFTDVIPIEAASSSGPPSRSRGMKGLPRSTIG